MPQGLRRSIVVAAALALVLGAGVVSAVAAQRFSDPVGDVKGGPGPDLRAVFVTHSPSAVKFRVCFAKAPPLGASIREKWLDVLLIGLDVPPRGLRRGTNGWFGLDYYVGLHGSEMSAILVRARPSKPSEPRFVARSRVTISGSTLSFSVRREALGDPAWLEFVVAAGREILEGTAGGGGDEAPARGAFHYQLRG